MDKNQLVERLNWRYAVKKFDGSKKLTEEQWQCIEEALVLSPSSYGLQPWKFIVIQDLELKKKLREKSWGQSQVEDCSHYVVFTVKDDLDADYVAKYVDRMVEVRGTPREKLEGMEKAILGDVVNGPRSKWVKEWGARQAYIALGLAMAAAAVTGIDTCPMEGLSPEDYDEILGLKGSGYHTVVALAVGFRAEDDFLNGAKKVRFKTEEVIEHR